MTLFLSTIINKMDAKSRVSVPSSFRNTLRNQSFKGVIAFPSYNDKSIDACGIERMENISNSLDGENNYSTEEFDLISLYFGEAEQLPFDKEGRIILPKKLINHAEIDKNVLFVGLGPTFQMWNPNSYERKKKLMVQNAVQKKLNPRLKPIPKGL
ncbi:MAG: division/cell wall cluster transcriptional repressor MraZ [Rickettsiales bacterium]|nr:division/cell wall cluster transcriptional repressor MraZ [Rickettsiales bacterium]